MQILLSTIEIRAVKMNNDEIISLPIGYLFASTEYGSMGNTFSAMKFCRKIIAEEDIGAIALQLDRRLQPLFDEAWLTKENLSVTSDNQPLITEKNGEHVINGRADMGFFHMVISYGSKKGIRCFAVDDLSLPRHERSRFIFDELLRLNDAYGLIVCICSATCSNDIKKRFRHS